MSPLNYYSERRHVPDNTNEMCCIGAISPATELQCLEEAAAKVKIYREEDEDNNERVVVMGYVIISFN
jgi:hypothetical protein